jgi:3-oxoacyl-(acyl-carrier-protein) synthase/NAD(P)-dependent dehydrogenase (short-subunit alcohol dehydrogenase family)
LISKAGAQDLAVCCVRTEQLGTLAQPSPKVPESPQIASPAHAPAVASSSGAHTDPQLSEASPSDSCVPRIAIVGQGCILPGGVSSPRDLFTAITEQRVGIVDQQFFDPHWSADFYSAELKPDRSNSHLFGRVRDEDISVPRGVAAHIFDGFTRTQKLLCVALAPCLASLKGAERIMCLLGSTADGFEDQDDVASLRLAGIDPCQPEVDRKMHTARSAGHDPHSAVQEVLDRIVGPGLKVTLVDAACASSLYSLALGMQALETNKADAVIAGGFFCPGPGNSCLFSQFRGTTSTGCRPFDAHADGVVFSEGAALVTLRRLADAERLGLTIDAIVAGAGLSSDGRSPSANVPQSKGQLLSLERCYANYGIDPASIIAIEGHGTSTPVGDGTELETLRSFFAGRTSSPIPVHSLKGLLGHAGWAAGTASVIAVCQYMRNALFPSQAMFRQPSAAVLDSAGTLMVSTSSIALPPLAGRIAVDGFGFGGANAHVVLENYGAHTSNRQAANIARPSMTHKDEELVVVAYHWQRPNAAMRFDREQVKVPKKFIILPQLADDMDISQALAIIVTDKVLGQLPQFDDVLRRETSLVLAMSGKTERGVEATLRIMTPRIRRVLQGEERLLEQLDAAYFSARPSGAYTLQCMMPNVASGRAALLLNLNGPNFVVDAGADSLEAAFTSAALLLRSGDQGGTKLVVVAAIDASGCRSTDPHVDSSVDNNVDSFGENADLGRSEFAVAYAVTTRRVAAARGLPVMASLDAVFRPAEVASSTAPVESQPYRQIQALQTALENASASAASTAELAEGVAGQVPPAASCAEQVAPSNCSPPVASRVPQGSDCQIQVPVWVEKPLAQAPSGTVEQRVKNMLVIVKAGFTRHRELCDALPEIAEQFLIAVVGDSAEQVVSAIGHPNLLAVDLTDAQTLPSKLENICRHTVDVVAVVDEATSWDLPATLASAALDNSLCELLFLIGKQEAARLKSGSLELWGVLVDAWNGQVHPCSGPIAGLLKSIQREFPAARSGTLCTQGLGIAAALGCLLRERVQSDREQEVACGAQFRLVRRLRPAAMDRNASPQVALDEHSIVVAIGGAKGVTAVMLESLLSDFKCKAIAIGRSPLEAGPEGFDGAEVEQAYYTRFLREHPQRSAVEMRNSFAAARGRWEAYQTVQKLASRGGQVEYLVADATDAEQMAATVQDIVSRYGRIDLLLYGAGVQKSKRLEDRSLADFRNVFSAKVTGLHHLIRACCAQLEQLPGVHILTSAYSVFGNDGQHDYGAANETLDRLCGLTQETAGRGWTSIAWLAWDGIGMTRGTEYRALAKKRRLSGVDPELGQRLFREVLAGHTRSAINVPMSEAEHVEYGVQTVPYFSAGTSGRVVEWDVQLSSIQCLPFHRVRNIPTLPGAWILDLLVGVGRKLAPRTAQQHPVVVHDMSFAKFVRTVNNREPNVRVVAQQCDNGVAVWMLADVLHPSGVLLAKDRICASAHLVWGTGEELAPLSKLRSSSELEARHVVRDPYCSQRKDVALSGVFDCLSDIELYDHGRTAKFMPSNCQTSADNIPSLLLDAAWRVGAMYTASRPNEVFVPVKIGRMTLPLETCCNSKSSSAWEIRSTAPRSEDRDVRWDRTEVFDQAGRLKMIIEDALATPIV